jgi:hypothetical protein
MLTGTIKSQVDKVWDAFWSGGISNPLEVKSPSVSLLDLELVILEALEDLSYEAGMPDRRLPRRL